LASVHHHHVSADYPSVIGIILEGGLQAGVVFRYLDVWPALQNATV
jgi:hypothetical protein